MSNFKTKPITIALFKCLVWALMFTVFIHTLSFIFAPVTGTDLMMKDMLATEDSDLVFVGASRTYRSFDPNLLYQNLGTNAFVLSSSGQSTLDSYYLLKIFLEKNNPQIVYIDASWNRLITISKFSSRGILSAMPMSRIKLEYLLNAVGIEDAYKALFPVTYYIAQDKRAFSPSQIKTNILNKFQSRGYQMELNGDNHYIKNGFVSSDRTVVGTKHITVLGSEFSWDSDDSPNKEALEYLRKCIELCKSKVAKVVLYSMPSPMPTMALSTGYDDYVTYLQEFALQYGLEYYDFGLAKASIFERKNEYFYDDRHLNSRGAREFTEGFCRFWQARQDPAYAEEDWFYTSYEDMMRDHNDVFSTWAYQTQIGIEANSTYSPFIMPEYEFLYETAGGDVHIVQDFGKENTLSSALIPVDAAKIIVHARAKGGSRVETYEFPLKH